MKLQTIPASPKVVAQSPTRLIRLPRVLERTARTRSAHYRDIQSGLFPPGVKIGARAAAWPEPEVETIVLAQIAGASAAELRELVAQLLAARKDAYKDLRHPATRNEPSRLIDRAG
jgi:prophage regulatory protein